MGRADDGPTRSGGVVVTMVTARRRIGRILVAAILVGAFSLSVPAAHAAPTSPPPRPSSPDLPAGPWPPSEVLAADPATRAAPEVAALAATLKSTVLADRLAVKVPA